MKIGIKEFRDRVSELAMGDETVILTHHGRPVARLIPERRKDEAIDLDKWLDARRKFAEKWRVETPDWAERLAAYGLDEDGEPFANEPRP